MEQCRIRRRPSPRRADAVRQLRARSSLHTLRVHSASARSVTAPVNDTNILGPLILRRKTDATGCQPSLLLDITSLVETPVLWVSRYAEQSLQQSAGGSVDVGQERLHQAGRR